MASVFCLSSFGQQFVHPGINQQAADLGHMKKMVLGQVEPYFSAFQRLKKAADTPYVIRPYTHVLRGPYGKPNIGGDALRNGANMAYDNALLWYITGDQHYADNAIQIINAWSPVLWSFDYNDAKLLAAWTGHLLCNAAEILRYTPSGWKQKDIDQFSNMLMTVYYPLMRYYYPQANGNWDGAIVHSLFAIAVFNDNRKIFDHALDHFLHAPVNGSLFKYIYPNGQCQETPRDQGHVQLGLGEFAGAAQIAYTQGVDLFSIADNRLALGYEYTASILLGESPQCYCTISDRAKSLRDDYEYVYRHYTANGVDVPWTEKAAEAIRYKASRSILSSVRNWPKKYLSTNTKPLPSKIGYIAGATPFAKGVELSDMPEESVLVEPGGPVQDALIATAGTGKWVLLKKGIHRLPATLKIPSGITLIGEGLETMVYLDPRSGMRDAMVNASDDMHDVTIRNLVVEVSNQTEIGTDPNTNRSNRSGYNRGGIIFRATKEDQMQRISLVNVTVRNATYNGIFISGAKDVRIIESNLSENGSAVVPGPRIQHNLLLQHCKNIEVSGSRFATSPFGSGIALDHCSLASVTNSEISKNGWYGLLVSESNNITIKGNLIEANDRSGVMLEYLFKGSSTVRVQDNTIWYNNGYGLESIAVSGLVSTNNTYKGNGNVISAMRKEGGMNTGDQEKFTLEKSLIMQ